MDKLVLGITKDTKKQYLTYVKSTSQSKLGYNLELQITEEKKVVKDPTWRKRRKKIIVEEKIINVSTMLLPTKDSRC